MVDLYRWKRPGQCRRTAALALGFSALANRVHTATQPVRIGIDLGEGVAIPEGVDPLDLLLVGLDPAQDVEGGMPERPALFDGHCSPV